MRFPAAGMEQNFEGGTGLNSMKTDKANTFQREVQAHGDRSRPARGLYDMGGRL